MSRYQRQIVLPEIGEEGQNKLKKTSILCIGAGGLGCPALLYLTAAGIGKIGIIDFDKVDETNLQRQILYTTSSVGQDKTQTAKQHLEDLNPDVQIDIHQEALNTDNIEALFKQYDLVIDGTDNFPAKYLINDAGVKFKTPVIYGAIQRFDGQVCVFDAQQGPCYRCLYPHPPETKVQNCAEAGVIGAVAGVIGTTQAMQAIIMAIGSNSNQTAGFEPLIGKLWTIDLRNMQSQTLSIPKNPNCPTCAQPSSEIKLERIPQSYTCSCTAGDIEEITAEELKQSTSMPRIILDVREAHEWIHSHIPGARFHSLSRLQNNEMPTDIGNVDIVVYCQKGVRSLKAAQALRNAGITNRIVSLRGGIEAYQSS